MLFCVLVNCWKSVRLTKRKPSSTGRWPAGYAPFWFWDGVMLRWSSALCACVLLFGCGDDASGRGNDDATDQGTTGTDDDGGSDEAVGDPSGS